MGRRARLPEDRNCGRRPGTGRRAARRLAGGRSPGRDGLHGATRHSPRATGGARARDAARRERAHGLPAARRARGRCRPRRPDACLHLALCARTRLSPCRAIAACAARRAAGRRRGIRRVSRFHRQRARAREGARARCRSRLDRQAHQPARPQRRLLVLSRGGVHRPAAAGRRAGQRTLRQLHGLHRCLSDARDRRSVAARRQALHLLSHDRAGRIDPRGVPRRDRQPRLWLRRLPARLPLEPLREVERGSRLPRAPRARSRRASSSSSPGRKRSSSLARRAARSAASATSAGCAISQWRSATPRPPPRRSRRSRHAGRWRCRCFGSTSTGRSRDCARLEQPGAGQNGPGARHCTLSIRRARRSRAAESTTTSTSRPCGRASVPATRTSK